MNNGWIKSYRKAQNSEIWEDHNAWRVFQWLLWNVDYETGKKTFGRKQISAGTGINEATVYRVTQRLHEKYQVIDMKSNNKFTEFSVLNWAKYQQDDDKVTQSVNEKEHKASMKSNTLKEIRNKNKEIITPLIPLMEKDFIEISEKYQVPLVFVKSKWDDVQNYCASTGKKYKDYRATLRNWVKKDAIKLRKEVVYESRRVSIDEIPN